MKYHLSSNQAKELILRATPLEIALPAPPDDAPDWVAWARNAIVQYGEYVVSAEPVLLYVTPNDGDGMSGLIGCIGDQPPHGTFYFGVDVIVVTLDPPVQARRDRMRCQWPGCAMLGDQRWPRIEARGDVPTVARPAALNLINVIAPISDAIEVIRTNLALLVSQMEVVNLYLQLQGEEAVSSQRVVDSNQRVLMDVHTDFKRLSKALRGNDAA